MIQNSDRLLVQDCGRCPIIADSQTKVGGGLTAHNFQSPRELKMIGYFHQHTSHLWLGQDQFPIISVANPHFKLSANEHNADSKYGQFEIDG